YSTQAYLYIGLLLALYALYILGVERVGFYVSSFICSIGFMLQQTLNNEFHKRKIDRQCITLVTQTRYC
ncbi:MAG: hypothetical protein KBH35_01685, partial [Bifidobacterium sp.]|nr:hypothetical protein [Bifidobacterium sp.]